LRQAAGQFLQKRARGGIGGGITIGEQDLLKFRPAGEKIVGAEKAEQLFEIEGGDIAQKIYRRFDRAVLEDGMGAFEHVIDFVLIEYFGDGVEAGVLARQNGGLSGLERPRPQPGQDLLPDQFGAGVALAGQIGGLLVITVGAEGDQDTAGHLQPCGPAGLVGPVESARGQPLLQRVPSEEIVDKIDDDRTAAVGGVEADGLALIEAHLHRPEQIALPPAPAVNGLFFIADDNHAPVRPHAFAAGHLPDERTQDIELQQAGVLKFVDEEETHPAGENLIKGVGDGIILHQRELRIIEIPVGVPGDIVIAEDLVAKAQFIVFAEEHGGDPLQFGLFLEEIAVIEIVSQLAHRFTEARLEFGRKLLVLLLAHQRSAVPEFGILEELLEILSQKEGIRHPAAQFHQPAAVRFGFLKDQLVIAPQQGVARTDALFILQKIVLEPVEDGPDEELISGKVGGCDHGLGVMAHLVPADGVK